MIIKDKPIYAVGKSCCLDASWTSVQQTVSLDTVKLLSAFIYVFIFVFISGMFIYVFISGIGSPFLTFRLVIFDTSISQFVLSVSQSVLSISQSVLSISRFVLLISQSVLSINLFVLSTCQP